MQSLMHAAVCSIFPCYVAYSINIYMQDRANLFFGSSAVSEPAVYRDPPNIDPYDFDHLAVVPCEPGLLKKYGVQGIPHQSFPPLFRSPFLVYGISIFLPTAITTWTLFRPGPRATSVYGELRAPSLTTEQLPLTAHQHPGQWESWRY
jgi:hypothetical protein